jgi:hypothetical protein
MYDTVDSIAFGALIGASVTFIALMSLFGTVPLIANEDDIKNGYSRCY